MSASRVSPGCASPSAETIVSSKDTPGKVAKRQAANAVSFFGRLEEKEEMRACAESCFLLGFPPNFRAFLSEVLCVFTILIFSVRKMCFFVDFF